MEDDIFGTTQGSPEPPVQQGQEAIKKPCPDCGREMTWLADGSRPRQHKCVPVVEKPREEVPQETPATAAGITAGAVIEAYIKTRDAIDAEKKAFEAKVADLKAFQAKREKWLMSQMKALGTEKLGDKTVGSCFIVTKDSTRVADGSAYFAWIGEDWENRKHFLPNSVAKSAVKQDLEENKGLPPGVDYVTFQEVQIRRA